MSQPTYPAALCALARQQLKVRDYRKAIDLYEQACLLDPDQADVHEGLATAYFMSGEYAPAVDHFIRVTRLDPRRGLAFVNLGAVYNRMGEYAKAIEVLRRGVSIDRKCAEGYYNLGIAHRKLQQYDLAVPAYREAIRMDPLMAEAYQNLGNVYVELGNLQQAIAQYKKALDIRPTFERARKALEQAESARDVERGASKPFGRLVEQATLHAGLGATDVSARDLTSEERELDRQRLFQICQGLGVAAQELLTHMQRDLEPIVRGLHRALIQEGAAPGTFGDAHTQFRGEARTHRDLSRRVKELIDQLREHEGSLQV